MCSAVKARTKFSCLEKFSTHCSPLGTRPNRLTAKNRQQQPFDANEKEGGNLKPEKSWPAPKKVEIDGM